MRPGFSRRLGVPCVLAALIVVAGLAPAARSQPGYASGASLGISFTITQPAGSSVSVQFEGGITDIVEQSGAGDDMLVFTAGITGFKVISGATQAGQPAVETVIVHGHLSSRTPVSGTAALPPGASVLAQVENGTPQTIRNGAFSLPTANGLSGALRPTLSTGPGRVRAGRRVRLSGGVAGDCVEGDAVALLSRAFVHTYSVAGVPAVYATVGRGGGFSVRTLIPAARKPGRYRITGRCGGGNLGVVAHIIVLSG